MSQAVSRLWHYLFLQDNVVTRAHVLPCFQRFMGNTTLASDGVNVAEHSIPHECKAEFTAFLQSQQQSHLPSAVSFSAWTATSSRVCKLNGNGNAGLQVYQMLGAPAVDTAASGSKRRLDGAVSHPGSSSEIEAEWAAVERDCTAMERLLPRVEAAVKRKRPSPDLTSRLLALAGSFGRMHAALLST
jgi:hypothetical protein